MPIVGVDALPIAHQVKNLNISFLLWELIDFWGRGGYNAAFYTEE